MIYLKLICLHVHALTSILIILTILPLTGNNKFCSEMENLDWWNIVLRKFHFNSSQQGTIPQMQYTETHIYIMKTCNYIHPQKVMFKSTLRQWQKWKTLNWFYQTLHHIQFKLFLITFSYNVLLWFFWFSLWNKNKYDSYIKTKLYPGHTHKKLKHIQYNNN